MLICRFHNNETIYSQNAEDSMKFTRFFILINLLLLTLSMTSCRRTGDDVWEDTKTAGRHVGRGFKTLGGKHGDSRMVYSPDEFYTEDGNYVATVLLQLQMQAETSFRCKINAWAMRWRWQNRSVLSPGKSWRSRQYHSWNSSFQRP